MAWTGRTAGAPLTAEGGRLKEDFPAGLEREMEMPDLASFAVGDLIQVVMPDARVLIAKVNLSREDQATTRVLAAGFENNSGGLTLRQDKARSGLFGRIVRVDEPIAYTVASDERGVVWVTERWRHDLLPACAPPMEPQVAGDPNAPQPAPGPMAGPPPILDSKPDATAVLYLDFDGEADTTYPDWPASNPGGVSFACGDPAISTTRMTEMWAIIAEDYAPFNITVTTDVSRYNAASAVGRRMRCIVTTTTTGVDANTAGVAWLNSFRPGALRSGNVIASDAPCWVTTPGYTGNTAAAIANKHRIMADAVAHEFGHTLGLSHDGTNPPAGDNYYFGHGTAPSDWAPLMGNYRGPGDAGRNVVQWSKGEYAAANNLEDDLAIIAGGANGFGYRADESSGTASAVPISLDGSQAGIISSAADFDFFALGTLHAGTVNITVSSGVAGTAQARNLDAGAELLGSGGTVVATANAANSMDATLTATVPAGIYYLRVFGSSYLTASTGYTDYGSLGAYTISGTLPPAPDTTAPVVAVTTPGHNSVISAITSLSGTASDAGGSGIAGNSVNVTLYQVASGKYWDGGNWSSSPASLSVPVTGGSWTYSGTLPDNSSNGLSGQYTLSASTLDNSGNASQAQAGVNNIMFSVDTIPPTAQVVSPANGSTVTTGSYVFSATATDASGIMQVNCFIRRNTDGYYWSGSGWDVPPINLVTTYNSSTDRWTCAEPLPQPGGQLANGSYNFIAIAYDRSGRTTQSDSVVSVDYHPIYQWTAGSHSDLDPYNNDYYWGNPANWSPNGIPDSQAIVFIDLNHTVRSTVSRTVHGFHMSTGALDFDTATDSLTITKTGSWTGGTFFDSVFIPPTTTFSISGPEIKQLWADAVIHNSGTTTWTGPGVVRGYQNSTWNNKPGSSFTMTGDGDVFANYYGGNVFNNEAGATFIKTGGASGVASTYIDEWTFNNASRIESQQGTLHFYTTLNLNAGSNLAGAGRVLLNGTTNLATVLASTGNPELVGTLNGTVPTAAFSGSNPLIWSNGWINGIFALQNGSVMELTTGDLKLLGSGTVFTNHGRVNWQAGSLRGYQNSTFNNAPGAVFDAVTDGDIFSNHYGGNIFNNAAGALFIKSGKGAVPGLSSYVDEWTFNNNGVIRSDDGLLQFHAILNLSGGGSIVRSGALPARILSTRYFVLTGTTTVSNITFETASDWHGNLTEGTSGNGKIATLNGGIFEWSGGTAHNTVSIAPGSVFQISGSALKQMGSGGVINHHGSATWSGTGEFRGYQNSTFNNLAGATFTAATDADFTNNYGGNAFVNATGATFSKTAGVDGILCLWAFNNAGMVAASSGFLGMANGGVSSGTFAPAAGGEIHFLGGQHDLLTGATCTGTGVTRVNGGSVNAVNPVNSDFSNGRLEISSGLVTSLAAGSFGVSGTIDWTGGMIAGFFNVAAGSDFALDGAGVKWIGSSGVINNSGAATWNPPGLLRGYQTGTWNNKSGGSFTMTGDGDVFSNNYSGNIFNNEAGAAFVKTGGAVNASTYIDEWTFNNQGALDCRQGTLHFYTTLNLDAGSNLLGAGRVLLDGTINLSTVLTSTGNPELMGTLNGYPAGAGFSGTQPFIWSNGGINGNFSLLSGSVLEITTGNLKQIGSASVFNNSGRVNWKAGLLRGFQNSTFNNEDGATFDAFTDGDVFANYYTGNIFNNKAGALFIKSGKSGTPGDSTFIDEWTFNNSGVIRSDDGLLRFHTPLNFEAGGSITRSGALSARVLSSYYCVLTGTTTVSNVTFESSGDWHGNLTPGTTGDGTIATANSGVFEWTGGTAHNTVNIAPGGNFAISGDAVKQLGGGGILNNGGIATRTGAGELRGFQNSTFVNLPGAVFNVMTAAPFTNYYTGNRLTNSGVLNIGAGAGISPLQWSFTQIGSGRLNLEIGGTNPAAPQFDQLNISGDANLAGTLGVSLINGFAPLANTPFPVLTFGSRGGTFDSVDSPGSIWGRQYNANNLTLVAKTYPTASEEWVGYFFTDPDSPDAQRFADPDHDGLPNLLEYALGRDPHAGDGSGTAAGTVVVSGETYLTLTFTRPAGDAALTDVTYAGERSAGLLAGGWAAAGVVTHSIVPVPGEPQETVTLRSIHPVGEADKEFLHLKIGVGE